MSAPKWTAGEWVADKYGLMVHAENGAMRVCDIRGWGRLTGKGCGALGLDAEAAEAIQRANAHLIAAAPELDESHEALIDAVILMAHGKPVRDLDERLSNAIRVRTKARGES